MLNFSHFHTPFNLTHFKDDSFFNQFSMSTFFKTKDQGVSFLAAVVFVVFSVLCRFSRQRKFKI